MTDTSVKAGQVWQHKNRGTRVEVKREANDDYNWMVVDVGSLDEKPMPEWLLTDDFILVVDAP